MTVTYAFNGDAYGSSIRDLCFDPADLAGQMQSFADPMAFVREAKAFAQLAARYEEDMAKARALKPARRVPGATMVVLPDAPWAKRRRRNVRANAGSGVTSAAPA